MIVAKFPMGRTMATPTALTLLSPADIFLALSRHLRGDWGELSDDDRQENELSLREGFRLLSVYRSSKGIRFWVITEADRSSTLVLMPEDY